MGWLTLISSAFKAVAAFLGLIDKANERTAGVNQERATENAIQAKASQNALQALTDDSAKPVRDSLRDGKF